MKKFITSLIILIALSAYGQGLYLGGSVDPKMLMQGPGHDYSETSSLDYKLRVGWEFERKKATRTEPNRNSFRADISFQDHQVITFRKFAVEVDYMLYDFPYRSANCYAGVLGGHIWRDAQGDGGFTYGLAFEYQQDVLSWLALSFKYDLYHGETIIQNDAITWWDGVRKDFHVGVIFKNINLK